MINSINIYTNFAIIATNSKLTKCCLFSVKMKSKKFFPMYGLTAIDELLNVICYCDF